jgi:hypothetical protein
VESCVVAERTDVNIIRLWTFYDSLAGVFKHQDLMKSSERGMEVYIRCVSKIIKKIIFLKNNIMK